MKDIYLCLDVGGTGQPHLLYETVELLYAYAIPRDARKAFLTCVYLSDEAFDYKTTPLNALEAYLGERYESALVISDETGVFPNGDLTFFLRRGYQDLGVVAREGTYCTLHLLEKQLRT